MLQPVALAHKSLADYTHIVGRAARRGDPRARRAAEGPARRPPERDRVRRRRVGDPLHAGAADARRRPRGRVAGDLRARGVLQRDEDHAQRAAGQPAGPHRGAVGDVVAVQRDERARALARLGRRASSTTRSRPRCYSLVPEKAKGWVWRCHIDVSTPNPATMERLLPYIESYPQSLFHVRALRAGGDGRRRQHRPAGDRPAGAEEHGAVARGRRRSSASSSASTSTRPMICQVSRFDPWKDPLGVIDAYRIVKEQRPERAARAGRLDGVRRPRGLGLLQLDARARGRRPGHPHPQQLQQRRRDRGQRVPVAGRRRDPEVHARGLRADRERGAVEGPAVHRRQRRRASRCRCETASPATWSTASRSARRARSTSSTTPRSARSLGRTGKEHVRDALPHAALPARLPEDLPRGAVNGPFGRWCSSPTAGPSPIEDDGSVKRGTGGLVTALTGLASHRDAIWIASAMTDGDVRAGRGARRPAVRGRGARGRRRTTCASSPPTPRPTTASTTSSPTRCSGSSSTTCGT